MHNRGSIVGNIPPSTGRFASRVQVEISKRISATGSNKRCDWDQRGRIRCAWIVPYRQRDANVTRILYRKRSRTDNVGLDVGLSREARGAWLVKFNQRIVSVPWYEWTAIPCCFFPVSLAAFLFTKGSGGKTSARSMIALIFLPESRVCIHRANVLTRSLGEVGGGRR